MRCLDCFLRSYAPDRLRKILERESCFFIIDAPAVVEGTTKFIQSKVDSETLTKDWLCPQHLVSSLAPTKYYKNQNQYFPTENLPLLETDASLLDLSTWGICSVPVKNLEFWEKRARKLVAINSHADLFSSAAYLCLQQSQCQSQLCLDSWCKHILFQKR